MIARIFAFIWCATFLTLLLFSALIFFVDLTPPEDIRRKSETALLGKDLSLIYDKEGLAGVKAIWLTISPAHPQFILE
jgi:hypothetical protein